MTNMIDGRALADAIRAKVKQRVAALDAPPGLAVLLVGNDPASHLYVSLKKKACEEAQIQFETFLYPADTSEQTLIDRVIELNGRADVTGILVQLPLPSQNADAVIAAIDPNKDVDGFHPENLRRLREGKPALAPAVALGIMKLVDATQQKLTGQQAVIVSSPLFAEPLVSLLKEQGVESVIVPPDDLNLATKTKTADLLLVAVGKPGLITGTMVKPGAIVIDVGTNNVGGKIVGDVDAASVKGVAGFLSPVPGGVGPMTVAMLLLNVLKAKQLQKN